MEDGQGETALPYLDMDIDYYDLHIKHRDETEDQVTVDAAEAIMRHGVGVKCATITPMRNGSGNTVSKSSGSRPTERSGRCSTDGIQETDPRQEYPPLRFTWKKPITIGRHAYGDVYSNTEIRVHGPGKAELVFTPADGGAPVQADHQGIYGTGHHPGHPQHR